jgi:hypothetical protein
MKARIKGTKRNFFMIALVEDLRVESLETTIPAQARIIVSARGWSKAESGKSWTSTEPKDHLYTD